MYAFIVSIRLYVLILPLIMQGTWFDVGLGACGDYDTNSDKIVAISSHIYGSGGNCNQVCPLFLHRNA